LKTQVEELSPVVRRLTVEVEPEAVEAAFEKAYRGLGRMVRVPGFRPGKIPRRILEQRYGDEVARDVQAELVRETYPGALDQQSLLPVAEPVIEPAGEKIIRGQPFRYRARVEVTPKLTPQGYTGLKLQKKPVAVSEADVQAELDKLQQSLGTLVPIDGRKVGIEGDWALVDYDLTLEAFSKGEPPQLSGNRDAPVELTAGSIIGGHIPELRGVEVGQSIDLPFVFPEDYRIAELRGQKGTFKVVLKALRTREVPPLDDELVKDLDEPGLTTLAELRERIRGRLTAERTAESDRDLRRQIEQALIAANPFEVPQGLVLRLQDAELRTLAQQIVQAGIDPKTVTYDEAKLREQSERRVRAELLYAAIADKEGLAVDDAQLDSELERVARETDTPLSKVKAHYARSAERESLREKMRRDKTLAFLQAGANIEEGDQKP
jgi:trigger factor